MNYPDLSNNAFAKTSSLRDEGAKLTHFPLDAETVFRDVPLSISEN